MVKKALVLLAILLLAFSASAKDLQLLVEDEEADTQPDAYVVYGPGPYTLTLKIKNNFTTVGTFKPIDLFLILDASESLNQELQAVKNFVEPLATEIQDKCNVYGIPDCFRLGIYVIEGGSCQTTYRTQRYCIDESCKTVKKKICIEWNKVCRECKRKRRTCVEWETTCKKSCSGDDVTTCRDICQSKCVDYDWVEYTTTCCRYEGCKRYLEYDTTDCDCSKWGTRKIPTGTSCSAPQPSLYASMDFEKAQSFQPREWEDDFGEIGLTDDMAMISSNLGYVNAYGSLEPWGQTIEHAVQAPEIGWRADTTRAIIVVTDEDDDSSRWNEAAQLAKDENIIVFGIIGQGPFAGTARNQMQIIANETGGEVYSYTDPSDIPAKILEAMNKIIGFDTVVFSKEQGPDWDGITGNIEFPPIPRDGGEHVYTVTGIAPAVWPHPSEFFRYRVQLKDDPTRLDDAWIEVRVNQAPIADFRAVPREGVTPLIVDFFDQTEDNGALALWEWDFGDGPGPDSTSGDQNPTHEYQGEGPFTVTLRVVDDGGLDDTATKEIWPFTFASIEEIKVLDIKEGHEGVIEAICNKDLLNGTLTVKKHETEDVVYSNPNYECNSGAEQTSTIDIGGIYAVTYKLDSENCQVCTRTKYFVVVQEVPETQSPENPFLEAAVCVSVAIGIILIKSRKRPL